MAGEQGLDQERLRRWVSFLALCGVLERATHEGILTGYYPKGGVAMELRFAAAARESLSGAMTNHQFGQRILLPLAEFAAPYWKLNP